MTTRQALLAVVILATVVTLAGLIVRGRARQCWSFVAYLCAVVSCGLLYIQERFYTPEFWMARQAIFDVLKTAVALEMAWQVVRAFPGALRTARVFALALLAGSTTLLAAGLSHSASYYTVLFAWQPRIVACTALLFTLTALLVAWYHLPIRSLHRAIMGGFTVYLAFFATVLGILQRSWHSDEARFWYGRVDTFAYLALVIYWAQAAWARAEERMPAPLAAPDAPERPALAENAA
jgi:hypothetical protein